MVVEGEQVPEEVLRAEEKAKDHAAPHVNFYDPSVYKVRGGQSAGTGTNTRRDECREREDVENGEGFRIVFEKCGVSPRAGVGAGRPLMLEACQLRVGVCLPVPRHFLLAGIGISGLGIRRDKIRQGSHVSCYCQLFLVCLTLTGPNLRQTPKRPRSVRNSTRTTRNAHEHV